MPEPLNRGASPETAVPRITLSDGRRIPQIGLGVLRIGNGDVSAVVRAALESGYRHIDTAAGYGNEEGTGDGIRCAGFAAGKPRESLWVTTKVRDSQQGYDQTLRAFDAQLESLGLDYVDMYMIHWPTPFNWRSGDTWRAMAQLRSQGLVKSIGVCNFMPEHLDRLYGEVGEYPVINQIELHPTWQQRQAVEYCTHHGIAVQAYSPMARGADLTAGGGIIRKIAKAHHKTEAQVILRWHIENRTVIIPKTTHRARMAENLSLFDFALTPDEHKAIDSLDSPQRAGHDPYTFSYS